MGIMKCIRKETNVPKPCDLVVNSNRNPTFRDYDKIFDVNE